MKIRHGELEACRKNPVDWLRQSQRKSTGRRMSYERLGVMAIYRFHKTGNVDDAIAYLTNLAASYHLRDQKRLDLLEEQLRAYSSWSETARPIVVKARINIRFDLVEDMFLAGEVARLDIDLITGGYRALLLTNKLVDLRTELRGPLLQLAIATKFNRDSQDVAIGVQRLDGSQLITVVFSDSDLRKAKREADKIASQIAAEI
jgi:hypothetical protein